MKNLKKEIQEPNSEDISLEEIQSKAKFYYLNKKLGITTAIIDVDEKTNSQFGLCFKEVSKGNIEFDFVLIEDLNLDDYLKIPDMDITTDFMIALENALMKK